MWLTFYKHSLVNSKVPKLETSKILIILQNVEKQRAADDRTAQQFSFEWSRFRAKVRFLPHKPIFDSKIEKYKMYGKDSTLYVAK